MRVSCTLAVAALVAACSSELPPQGQVVLAMDADAPELFDRVLVEIFPPGSTEPCDECHRELPVEADKIANGTFSFGFAPRPRVVGYVARLRMFRSRGVATPRTESTIELVGYLPAVGEDGKTYVTATFHAEDVGRPRGTMTAPIIFDAGTTKIAPWSELGDRPCRGSSPAGAACVHGGAYFMGDPRVNIADTVSGGAREHLVVLSPFHLDEHEVTVGELRASGLASYDSRGKALDPIDDSKDDIAGACDFTAAVGPWEALPVDCVGRDLATRYCQMKGGDLPSEAELEMVGSRRGRALAPWGDRDAVCDDGVVLRFAGGCKPTDPFALESRVLPSAPNDGAHDRVDTILDVGASLSEWTRDTFARDDQTCWSSPLLLRDPVCTGDGDPSVKGRQPHDDPRGPDSATPLDLVEDRRGDGRISLRLPESVTIAGTCTCAESCYIVGLCDGGRGCVGGFSLARARHPIPSWSIRRARRRRRPAIRRSRVIRARSTRRSRRSTSRSSARRSTPAPSASKA